MKKEWKLGLPIVLMIVFAITRWPDFLPPNFSAAYGIAFCAGVYFSGRATWYLPLVGLLVSDLAINLFYYDSPAVGWYMLPNYLAFAAIIGIGTRFRPQSSWFALLGGGLTGALLFYLITNTASWLSNPLYPKNFGGWLQALTVGTPGWPHTWEFFRNTLLSGGLFTGLFAGAMKLGAALEREEDDEAPEETEDATPEEAKA